MLTGSELLAKVKELGDVSKSDLARSCGDVSTTKDGSERLHFTAFYKAMLEAKGKGGRKLSYTAMLDLQTGDEFEIKLSRKQIKLIPPRDR